MGKFAHHKYTYTKPYGSPRHNWEVLGPNGAVHFHASLVKDYPTSCGLEFHFCQPPYADQAPSHIDCWLTGGRCWHDGTSLYAQESLWPMIEPLLRAGDHEAVFRLLEHEYESQSGFVIRQCKEPAHAD